MFHAIKTVYLCLQSKLRELERKYELQAIKHEELTLEMTQLKQQTERSKPVMSTIDIQTDNKTQLANGSATRPLSRSSHHGMSQLSIALLQVEWVS